ncbi:MAG: hypothetical protein RL328_1746 [Acidobacteriota bacterium]|jgi:hypothetical protein
MKTKLLVMMLLAASGAFARTNIFIGFGVNNGAAYGGYYAAPPPPPPPPAMYAPPAPGPGYVWIQGYWGYAGGRYAWNNGYWTRPPRGRGKWVAPRYHKGRYYQGYWR